MELIARALSVQAAFLALLVVWLRLRRPRLARRCLGALLRILGNVIGSERLKIAGGRIHARAIRVLAKMSTFSVSGSDTSTVGEGDVLRGSLLLPTGQAGPLNSSDSSVLATAHDTLDVGRVVEIKPESDAVKKQSNDRVGRVEEVGEDGRIWVRLRNTRNLVQVCSSDLRRLLKPGKFEMFVVKDDFESNVYKSVCFQKGQMGSVLEFGGKNRLGCLFRHSSKIEWITSEDFSKLSFMSLLPPVVEPNLPEWSTEVHAAFGHAACPIPETEHRGITLEQLRKIKAFAKFHCHNWHDTALPEHSKTSGLKLHLGLLNLYHVSEWVIKPATKQVRCDGALNCSFVELIADGPQTPVWYISHWWGERVTDFMKCIHVHNKLRELSVDKDPMWICAYANRQHSLDQELVADPTETSFFRAMKLSIGMLLVIDSGTRFTDSCTVFSRIWCQFETAMTFQFSDERDYKFDIVTTHQGDATMLADGVTPRDEGTKNGYFSGALCAKSARESSFPLHMIKAGLCVQFEMAEASQQEDKWRILNCLANRAPVELDLPPPKAHPNYAKTDKRLGALFAVAAWPRALESGKLKEMKLAQILQTDAWRRSLAMALRSDKLTGTFELGEGLQGLASLKYLNLNLMNCSGLTSVDDLGVGLQGLPSLKRLVLNLGSCYALTSVVGLGHGLPRLTKLEHLELNLCRCTGLIHTAQLWQGLGNTSLIYLNLNLSRSSELLDITELAKCLGKLTSLTNLQLLLDECAQLTCTREFELSLGRLVSLTHLTLSLSRCKQLASVMTLVRTICSLPLLLSLNLCLNGCSQLDHRIRTRFSSPTDLSVQVEMVHTEMCHKAMWSAVRESLIAEQDLQLSEQAEQVVNEVFDEMNCIEGISLYDCAAQGLAKLGIPLSNKDLQIQRTMLDRDVTSIITLDVFRGLVLRSLHQKKRWLCEDMQKMARTKDLSDLVIDEAFQNMQVNYAHQSLDTVSKGLETLGIFLSNFEIEKMIKEGVSKEDTFHFDEMDLFSEEEPQSLTLPQTLNHYEFHGLVLSSLAMCVMQELQGLVQREDVPLAEQYTEKTFAVYTEVVGGDGLASVDTVIQGLQKLGISLSAKEAQMLTERWSTSTFITFDFFCNLVSNKLQQCNIKIIDLYIFCHAVMQQTS